MIDVIDQIPGVLMVGFAAGGALAALIMTIRAVVLVLVRVIKKS